MTDRQITADEYRFLRDYQSDASQTRRPYRAADTMTSHAANDEELWSDYDRTELIAGKIWVIADQDYSYFATVHGNDRLLACKW